MRVALVGCGWFALRAHLPALQKLERVSEQALGFRVSLYALCSRSPDNIQKAVKRLDKDKRTQVKTFLSLEDVLTDQLVDVIDLVLPIAVMPDAIQRCLMAGKSVLSEKPIAPSPEVLGRLWVCYLSHAPARQPCARCWMQPEPKKDERADSTMWGLQSQEWHAAAHADQPEPHAQSCRCSRRS